MTGQVRTVAIADLPRVERLRLETFSTDPRSVWHGVPAERQLEMRLALWQLRPHTLAGVLIIREGDRLAGTVALDTAATLLPFGLRSARVLTGLGPRRMPRALAALAAGSHAPACDEALLHDLAVAPPFRRRATGRALVLAAEDLARRWGVRFVSVAVERVNAPALGLFEALGYRFEQVGHRGLRRLVLPGPSFVRARKDLDAG